MPTSTYNYTGGWQYFHVPAGVSHLYVTINGAGSGGVAGGQIIGRLAVRPGEYLYLIVGQAGVAHNLATPGGPTYGSGGQGGPGEGNNGGDSGGGYSAIRRGSASGTWCAGAGGAGGSSGDGGLGGVGGANIGGIGTRGNAGSGATVEARGGGQTNGGAGGYAGTAAEHLYAGAAAPNTGVARAGTGGHPNQDNPGPGGGGGGGGFRSGGGGHGGANGFYPGGGGGGGSSNTGQLSYASNVAGGGNTGNGSIVIYWDSPAATNDRPLIPGITVPTEGQLTRATSTFTVTANISDPDGDRVKLVARYSTDIKFQDYAERSGLPNRVGESHAHVTLTGLAQNSRYYLRVWAEDEHGARSFLYSERSFYTNHSPNAPTLTAPADAAVLDPDVSNTFSWTHSDPDGDGQNAAQLRWRLDATIYEPWTTVTVAAASSYIVTAGHFSSNSSYVWQVRTRDPQGTWGAWCHVRGFTTVGDTKPPTPLSPIKGEAVVVDEDATFSWRFNDPDRTDVQVTADLQWRVAGAANWTTLTGTVGVPGASMTWVLPPETFLPNFKYEWQVRTYDSGSGGAVASNWSTTSFFYTTPPVANAPEVIIGTTVPAGVLGCGTHRVFIYDRGGLIRRGEITPIASLTYGRKRDDISVANLTTAGFGDDCCELLTNTHSMHHELVIYRDEKRVWEGPITRMVFGVDTVEIEAHDCMYYVYRRIMRQGYNDTYPNVRSVVYRASRVVLNALAPDDPNLLPYLTVVQFPDDARESRARSDYSATAWEELDDLAAQAGLDYVTVGRRIILNDTHRPLGRLPEMRDHDFFDPPVVTEYGASLATDYAVTNNDGLYAIAHRDEDTGYYGLVEMLASSYSDSSGNQEQPTTIAAQVALVQSLTEQAHRNIANRYPAPLIVHVPDNTTLNPETPIDFSLLVPGVWAPLVAERACRSVSQWQKLDAVTVNVTATGGEQVQVVMSPAPNGGADPDATGEDVQQ